MTETTKLFIISLWRHFVTKLKKWAKGPIFKNK